MEFAIEIRCDEESENIIHRKSCIIAPGRLYPLGKLTSFDLALSKAKKLGFMNLNGCHWCCFWNHRSR